MEKIGKYTILKKIGEGATSLVYLCEDPFSQRQVAVKLAREEGFMNQESEDMAEKLFLTEASLAGQLEHPYIVQIIDAVADESSSYIVMEYVDGTTLEHYTTPDTLLPVSDVVEIIFKCTRAMDYAQRLGVIHRDLKPANLLMGHKTGDVKVSDFGAAMIVNSKATQIARIGSPAYMSPEQIQDEKINHQTDIYSLGVVMYQLLTGKLPFQASNNASLLYQIIHTQPTPPTRLRKDIPDWLERIVLKAMARERRERYASWEEFSLELAEGLQKRKASRKQEPIKDSEKYNMLTRMPFFKEFSEAQIWEVLGISTWENVKAGKILMTDGEKGDFFCILAQGEVKVTKNGKLLNVLKEGEVFGEMSYVSRVEKHRSADVTTLRDSCVMRIMNQSLDRASNSCRHCFDRAFLTILAERLAMENARIAG